MPHCNFCKLSFPSTKSLVHHKVQHISELQYSCSKCTFSSIINSGLNTYVLNHVLFIIENPDTGTSFYQRSLRNSHLCGNCSQSFANFLELVSHNMGHLKDSNNQCHICKLVFSDSLEYVIHSHVSGTFKCEKCGLNGDGTKFLMPLLIQFVSTCSEIVSNVSLSAEQAESSVHNKEFYTLCELNFSGKSSSVCKSNPPSFYNTTETTSNSIQANSIESCPNPSLHLVSALLQKFHLAPQETQQDKDAIVCNTITEFSSPGLLKETILLESRDDDDVIVWDTVTKSPGTKCATGIVQQRKGTETNDAASSFPSQNISTTVNNTIPMSADSQNITSASLAPFDSIPLQIPVTPQPSNAANSSFSKKSHDPVNAAKKNLVGSGLSRLRNLTLKFPLQCNLNSPSTFCLNNEETAFFPINENETSLLKGTQDAVNQFEHSNGRKAAKSGIDGTQQPQIDIQFQLKPNLKGLSQPQEQSKLLVEHILNGKSTAPKKMLEIQQLNMSLQVNKKLKALDFSKEQYKSVLASDYNSNDKNATNKNLCTVKHTNIPLQSKLDHKRLAHQKTHYTLTVASKDTLNDRKSTNKKGTRPMNMPLQEKPGTLQICKHLQYLTVLKEKYKSVIATEHDLSNGQKMTLIQQQVKKQLQSEANLKFPRFFKGKHKSMLTPECNLNVDNVITDGLAGIQQQINIPVHSNQSIKGSGLSKEKFESLLISERNSNNRNSMINQMTNTQQKVNIPLESNSHVKGLALLKEKYKSMIVSKYNVNDPNTKTHKIGENSLLHSPLQWNPESRAVILLKEKQKQNLNSDNVINKQYLEQQRTKYTPNHNLDEEIPCKKNCKQSSKQFVGSKHTGIKNGSNGQSNPLLASKTKAHFQKPNNILACLRKKTVINNILYCKKTTSLNSNPSQLDNRHNLNCQTILKKQPAKKSKGSLMSPTTINGLVCDGVSLTNCDSSKNKVGTKIRNKKKMSIRLNTNICLSNSSKNKVTSDGNRSNVERSSLCLPSGSINLSDGNSFKNMVGVDRYPNFKKPYVRLRRLPDEIWNSVAIKRSKSVKTDIFRVLNHAKECSVLLHKLPDYVYDFQSYRKYENKHSKVKRKLAEASSQQAKVKKQKVSIEGNNGKPIAVCDVNASGSQILSDVFITRFGNIPIRQSLIDSSINAPSCSTSDFQNPINGTQNLITENSKNDTQLFPTFKSQDMPVLDAKTPSNSFEFWSTKRRLQYLRHRIVNIKNLLEVYSVDLNKKSRNITTTKDLRIVLSKLPDYIYEKHIKCKPIMLPSISSSIAKTKELRIVLCRLPEYIYEKHLKCKPIMMSDVLPRIIKVVSLYQEGASSF